MTDLSRLDALAQAELVRRGEVTALELVDAAIERIERVDPQLNAVVTPMFERARERAGRPLPDGPLAGAPYLLKDIGATVAGVRQTKGSRALRSFVSDQDTELARRLEAAGLLIVGKTSTPEFSNHSTTEPVLFGPTRNPWDPGRTTGGSSGGSAAAVAAGLVPAAHANDGAGSIRIPASCCGLVGLKPTRGRNSWAPSGESMSGIAVEHAVTRSVRDSAAILDATSGRVPGDPYSAPPPARPFLEEVGADPGSLRIAWSPRPPFDTPIDPDCERAARETAGLLESLGHHVEETSPTFDVEVLDEPLLKVWAVANVRWYQGAIESLGREPRLDELETTTWELIDYGRGVSGADLVEALDRLAIETRRIAGFFATWAAWLTPTLAQPPMPLGILNRSYGGALEWWRVDGRFNPWNPIANFTGQPAVSLPAIWSQGLPIGILFTGRYGDEATLLRLAAQLEVARPWADRLPPIHASTVAQGGTASSQGSPGPNGR